MYPLERVTGSCKCHGKRCAVCLNVSETSTFTSSVTHNTYKINHKLKCNSKCLIYLFTCKQCAKQYDGQTIDDSHFDGTIIKTITENINVLKRVCRNIFLAIFRARVTMDFWLMFLYSSSTRRILQILLNEKAIGEKFSKRWHLLGLILKTVFD